MLTSPKAAWNVPLPEAGRMIKTPDEEYFAVILIFGMRIRISNGFLPSANLKQIKESCELPKTKTKENGRVLRFRIR